MTRLLTGAALALALAGPAAARPARQPATPTAPAPRPAAAPAALKAAAPSPAPAATPAIAPGPVGPAGVPQVPGWDRLEALCQPPGGACCDAACGPAGRMWAEFDLLLWFVQGTPLPPLVTTAPAGTPRPAAGALGLPGTTVLAGGGRDGFGLLPGFRFRGGFWLNDEQTCGLEGDFFFLGRGSNSAAFTSAGGANDPVLARPFTNAVTGLPDSQLVAFPGVLAGTATSDDSLTFIGGGVWARGNLCCDCTSRLDLLAGYRVLGLTETLTVTENLTPLNNAAVPAGTTILVQDRIHTRNVFNGGLLGLAYGYWGERWSVEGRGAVALGNIHRTVDVTGSTTVLVPGQPPVVRPGGLLALPSNSGRQESDAFAVAPEVGVNLGYRVTENVRVQVGYTFLYLNNVARPGTQIDPVVDPRQLPPALATGARPAPGLRTTDFWAQGVNIGLQLRY